MFAGQVNPLRVLILAGVGAALWLGATWLSGPPVGSVTPRARVARVLSDLRSLSTALLDYRADHGVFPDRTIQLTTPQAYLVSEFVDPFAAERGVVYRYRSEGDSYVAYSIGPDGRDGAAQVIYDPTNGSESEGDIIRVGSASSEAAVTRADLPGTRVPTH